MLDSVTKKRIDDLRDILVGKIPSPQSQVEQITTGLIYKFMYDLDVEAVDMGGVPSFFVGDFEQYSWNNLFDPKLGGKDKVKLYGDAIEHLYTHPTAPQLFRDIFKNSYLPFKDPSTLNMFLKEINEFHYSHSEKLGDAFEYLLSFMGSQGDAGQFRTPRHIIDFIVEIVNPQKNETILDPACGTAGFLISSYKHILKQNTGKKLGDKLTAVQRKKVGVNLAGYDISPDMTRISLVNMFLHNFANPQIHEYDTLSSEDRWNEYYDVILANPPFFSPTGGIQPHSRFGVQSTRAEVLFVDYIMEHLKPKGRAGVIVPEGVIFQTGNAYKTLRKKLIEDSLVGVISLPAGVFNPYSGVKTSILILDKEMNQKSDTIFFAKVENDGFSLGANRNPIEKNDLPSIADSILDYRESGVVNSILGFVQKGDILDKLDTRLTGTIQNVENTHTVFDHVSVMDVCSFHRGVTYKKEDVVSDGGTCVLRANNIDLSGSLNLDDIKQISKEVKFREDSRLRKNDIFMCIASGSEKHIGKTTLISSDTDYLCGGFMGILRCAQDDIEPKFLIRILLEERFNIFLKNEIHGANIRNIKADILAGYYFPLPPIEVQQEIVEELEGYQKIIDGCRQVVENYKPTIDIDPSWEMVELGDIIKLSSGKGLTKKNFRAGTHKVYGGNGVTGHHDEYFIEEKTIVIGRVGAYCGAVHITSSKCWITDNGLYVREFLKPINIEYLAVVLTDLKLNQYAKVGGQPSISQSEVMRLSVPLPSIEQQDQLVSEISATEDVISGNKKLIEIYTKKIQDRISKVWGEESV